MTAWRVRASVASIPDRANYGSSSLPLIESTDRPEFSPTHPWTPTAAAMVAAADDRAE